MLPRHNSERALNQFKLLMSFFIKNFIINFRKL